MPTVGVQKNSFQKEELKLRAERLVRVHQMQVRNHGRRVFQTVETEEYTLLKSSKAQGVWIIIQEWEERSEARNFM